MPRTPRNELVPVPLGERTIYTSRSNMHVSEVAFLHECSPRALRDKHEEKGLVPDPAASGSFTVSSVRGSVADDGVATAFLGRILQDRYEAPRLRDDQDPGSLVERLRDLL